MQTKLKDNGRMWLWGFLAVIVMSQLYVVREVLAAFALFALGFATIATHVKYWEGLVRFCDAIRS